MISTPVPRKFTRAETAYHEAGHATAAWLLGLRFKNVTIVPGRQGTLGCITELNAPKWFRPGEQLTPRIRMMAERRIVTFFAGKCAQEQYLGKKVRSGYESDYDSAVALAATLCSDSDVADAYLHYCLTASQALIRRHWSAVDRVAKTLLEKETVGFREVGMRIR
ncbi:MAG: M50 family metallopeptidase [Bryobacteraceae bacterium]